MSNIDDILLNNPDLAGPAQEKYAEREMRQRKQGELSVESELKPGSIQKVDETFQKIIKERSIFEAIKQGTILGEHLRREIADGKFDAFIAVLILSLFKDIFDGITLGTIGSLLNIAISITLFIVFFLRKSRFKRWLIKKFVWRYIIIVIIEFIPGINIFPAYTVSAILLKLKVDKRTKDLESRLEEVETEINKLKKEKDEL